MELYIKISRYSDDGFYPQKQDYHLAERNVLLGQKGKDYQNINFDFHLGVWVFVLGCEDKYLMNHLENDVVRNLQCWEAEIPANTVVYQHDAPYLKSGISTAGKEKEKESGAFFIPECSLRFLQNIKQVKNWLYDE